ncbi:MAG: 30S ribosome-binding factor RbfA [Planctomycetia bacterium]|nr:30S ribosome-binding factor RbfA [Planctomycetia bacterium]
MPLPRRIARLQQLILEVAAETVQRRLADPRLRLVTLTRVKLAPDLSTAVVYYSAMAPSDLERRATARALAGAASLVQSVVGDAMGTRTTPKLSFRYDATLAQAAHLEGIFEKLRAERGEAVVPETLADKLAADDDDGADDDEDGDGSLDAQARDDDDAATDEDDGDDAPPPGSRDEDPPAAR